MKYRWDFKYLYWGITAFLVLALNILFYNSISKIGAIFSSIGHFFNIIMPVVYGIVIAYLLTPILNFIEKKILFKLYDKFNLTLTNKLKKVSRGISVFLSLALLLLMIYGLLYMLIPQLIDSITTLVISSPAYLDNFEKFAIKIMKDNPTLEEYFVKASEYFMEFLNDLLPQIKVFLSQLYSGIFDFIVVLKNVVIGFIISIYLMNSKEVFTGQSKKFIYALFKPKRANFYIESFRFVHKKFSGFIVGKIIDSIIIGIICYIVTSIMKTPYNILISVIIGITNVIPFFGPYIGAIPSAFLILLVNPLQAVYFVIFIIILQTFDGNILGPRILSESTDLSSFWIIFAILLMGGLFGIIGMFIGVPIFAVVYAAIARYINNLLKAKKMPLSHDEYLRLDYVALGQGVEKYGEFVYMDETSEEEEKSSDSKDKTSNKDDSNDSNISKTGILKNIKSKLANIKTNCSDDETSDKVDK